MIKGKLESADFENGTMTFKIDEDFIAKSGDYIIQKESEIAPYMNIKMPTLQDMGSEISHVQLDKSVIRLGVGIGAIDKIIEVYHNRLLAEISHLNKYTPNT